jgi:hypothetical protein
MWPWWPSCASVSVEIQYLKTTITDVQREEFGGMVEATVSHIEAGEFQPHSGIRFPRNGCVSSRS